MILWHIVVLALVQGITEFLPISSQAHLILTSKGMGWQDQGLLIDVALHVGTLAAVLLYFWQDVWRMLKGLGNALSGTMNDGARLALQVVLATLPVVAAGYFLIDHAASLRDPLVIGWATLGFGILLYLADRLGLRIRRVEHMSFAGAFVIGLAQIGALVPGASRSGVTMTAARMLGFEREEAARFSLLLAIPAIIAAGTLEGIHLYEAEDVTLTRDAVVAAGFAFLSALIAIALMMRWLRRASFTPFVLYRVVLGGGLLAFVYWGLLPSEWF
ncbi:MAG: undecaprenyl-diphosphate phosphatase [Alphaproteobacteria bacterium]|nr:undecaprenyl-diphosphate phosphatase [Alphaproteobacteria bacterium]